MTDTPRPIYVQKGNRWSEWRAARGLSLRELAALTGINRGTLSRIEHGLSPSPEQATRLVRVLVTEEDVA